jgi:hypothetical protein
MGQAEIETQAQRGYRGFPVVVFAVPGALTDDWNQSPGATEQTCRMEV